MTGSEASSSAEDPSSVWRMPGVDGPGGRVRRALAEEIRSVLVDVGLPIARVNFGADTSTNGFAGVAIYVSDHEFGPPGVYVSWLPSEELLDLAAATKPQPEGRLVLGDVALEAMLEAIYKILAVGFAPEMRLDDYQHDACVGVRPLRS